MFVDPLLPLFALGPKRYRAWPLHQVVAHVEYRLLSVLLTQGHEGDAHVAAYSVPSVPRRLSTEAYERVEGGIPMAVFLFDIDCAASHRAQGGSGAVRADDGWWLRTRQRIEALERAHPGTVAYRTRGGARVVLRPSVPHVITDVAGEIAWKRLYLSRLAYLARRFGLIGDPSISDWPRLVRLPHVTRDGTFARGEMFGDPHAVGALEYEPGTADDAADLAHVRQLAEHAKPWSPALRILARNAVPSPRTRTARPARVVAPRSIDLGTWEQLAADLGRALRRHHGRHLVHRALAGACYARGVPLDRGPDLAHSICLHSGETDDRPQVWQTTADRVRGGAHVEGYGSLAATWPDLAAIVDAALPSGGGARDARDELDARRFAEVSALDASALVRAALEGAGPGLSVVRITEGAGKTRTAAEVLRERALAVGTVLAVPSHAKTVYVAPSHAVASEVAEALRGTRAEYWRSVLSVRDATGTPACRYHVPVSALVRARHAVATWCEGRGMGHRGADSPCPERDTCPALSSTVVHLGGVGTPAVVVTVHALLREALAWAGENALVVIDEDPDAVAAYAISRADLEAAAATSARFSRGERWRGVVARMLAAGLERGELPRGDAPLSLVAQRGAEALAGDEGWTGDARDAFGTVDPGPLLHEAAIRAVWHERHNGQDQPPTWIRRGAWAPSLRPAERSRVFTGRVDDALSRASETHAVLGQLLAGVVRSAPAGLAHDERAVAVVEVAHDDPTRRVLRAVIASAPVAAAMRRSAPTVLLDATADLAVVGALAGGTAPVTEIRVADGAPVTRRLLFWSGASRRGALDGDRVRWGDGLERYLRAALAQAVEVGARRLGLFTWKALADVIRAGTDPVAAKVLGELAALGVTVIVGHFGHARGRNDWSTCDALVSFGDPRPNVGATRAIAAVLGLSAEHSDVYRRATAAEVSQVAGRLRAPWRTTPALHVHVGTVPPASWDARAQVQELPKGAATGVSAADVLEAVAVYGSARAGAAAVGVSTRTAERRSVDVSHTGNACPQGCHRLRQVTPTENNSRAACGGVGDTAKPQGNLATLPPREQPRRDQRELIAAAGGAPAVAKLCGVGRATAYHWASGARPLPDEARRTVEAALRPLTHEPPSRTPATHRFEVPPVAPPMEAL